jgi:hypothetical protein
LVLGADYNIGFSNAASFKPSLIEKSENDRLKKQKEKPE